MSLQDEMNAALQIAGQRLLEAERVWQAANKTAREAWDRRLQHYDDAAALLKALRDLNGERGSQAVPVGPPEMTRGGPLHRVTVYVSGHKGSLKKAEAVQQRLCGAIHE